MVEAALFITATLGVADAIVVDAYWLGRATEDGSPQKCPLLVRFRSARAKREVQRKCREVRPKGVYLRRRRPVGGGAGREDEAAQGEENGGEHLTLGRPIHPPPARAASPTCSAPCSASAWSPPTAAGAPHRSAPSATAPRAPH